MSRVFDIASEYLERLAVLDPIWATQAGIPGHDERVTDYSPEGHTAVAELRRLTMGELAAAPIDGEADRIAKAVIADQLSQSLREHDAGEHFRNLNILNSPFQFIRRSFDLMPRATDADWRNIGRRLDRVAEGLSTYERTLREGIQRGTTPARRQVLECAKQAAVWTGMAPGSSSFFDGLAVQAPIDLSAAAGTANEAYRRMRAFLLEELAPKAAEKDAIGRERYQLLARVRTGAELDLDDTYAWGWSELRHVEDELRATALRVKPGATIEDAIELLETDPKRAIDGVEPFQRWLQELEDRTIAELDGRHFDIPEPAKRLEVMIAPPGGALAMYYTSPSEDFSRPGRTWYPTGGKTRFPLWGEVSVAYHEGVPGHHLERASARYLGDHISRFQRLVGGTTGYIEGWALYAERLMSELGYLENPDYYMGLLRSQALRCVRVVIDIGMHLELPIPGDADFHRGERWTPELGQQFANERSREPVEFMTSEVTRYLGLPAQAICYKVGERDWLAIRDAERQRLGAGFSLRDFHKRALGLGPMGLHLLKREITVTSWCILIGNMEPVVEVRGLTKRYGAQPAVEDVNFDIDAGSIVAILGPNGAGKTTTVEILEGFKQPSSGTVRVLGLEPMSAGPELRRRVGIMLQSGSLDGELTVAETLDLYARLYPRCIPPSALVSLVGLDEQAPARVQTLSGGQQRRLEFALAISGDPELVFLDEPTTGFDPSARREAWQLIRQLHGLGKTIVMTTHYLDEAQQLASRVIVLSAGRIVADAAPGRLTSGDAQAVISFRLPSGMEAPRGFGLDDGVASISSSCPTEE
ncbi:MAG: DUF885 family protein, partial [Chloroflexi bacterium]|nr:DUF885 family protein [Chloroflexota bacterium]